MWDDRKDEPEKRMTYFSKWVPERAQWRYRAIWETHANRAVQEDGPVWKDVRDVFGDVIEADEDED